MSKLDLTVFVVEDGQIIESRIRDLSGYIDETTTPHGVAPRYHVREYPKFSINGKNFESREAAEDYAADNEMPDGQIVEGTSYELWTWGHAGNFPRQIAAFDTEAEAQDALEETFYIDFFNSDFMPFFSRAEAEKFLAENIS